MRTMLMVGVLAIAVAVAGGGGGGSASPLAVSPPGAAVAAGYPPAAAGVKVQK